MPDRRRGGRPISVPPVATDYRCGRYLVAMLSNATSRVRNARADCDRVPGRQGDLTAPVPLPRS